MEDKLDYSNKKHLEGLKEALKYFSQPEGFPTTTTWGKEKNQILGYIEAIELNEVPTIKKDDFKIPLFNYLAGRLNSEDQVTAAGAFKEENQAWGGIFINLQDSIKHVEEKKELKLDLVKDSTDVIRYIKKHKEVAGEVWPRKKFAEWFKWLAEDPEQNYIRLYHFLLDIVKKPLPDEYRDYEEKNAEFIASPYYETYFQLYRGKELEEKDIKEDPETYFKNIQRMRDEKMGLIPKKDEIKPMEIKDQTEVKSPEGMAPMSSSSKSKMLERSSKYFEILNAVKKIKKSSANEQIELAKEEFFQRVQDKTIMFAKENFDWFFNNINSLDIIKEKIYDFYLDIFEADVKLYKNIPTSEAQKIFDEAVESAYNTLKNAYIQNNKITPEGINELLEHWTTAKEEEKTYKKEFEIKKPALIKQIKKQLAIKDNLELRELLEVLESGKEVTFPSSIKQHNIEETLKDIAKLQEKIKIYSAISKTLYKTIQALKNKIFKTATENSNTAVTTVDIGKGYDDDGSAVQEWEKKVEFKKDCKDKFFNEIEEEEKTDAKSPRATASNKIFEQLVKNAAGSDEYRKEDPPSKEDILDWLSFKFKGAEEGMNPLNILIQEQQKDIKKPLPEDLKNLEERLEFLKEEIEYLKEKTPLITLQNELSEESKQLKKMELEKKNIMDILNEWRGILQPSLTPPGIFEKLIKKEKGIKSENFILDYFIDISNNFVDKQRDNIIRIFAENIIKKINEALSITLKKKEHMDVVENTLDSINDTNFHDLFNVNIQELPKEEEKKIEAYFDAPRIRQEFEQIFSNVGIKNVSTEITQKIFSEETFSAVIDAAREAIKAIPKEKYNDFEFIKSVRDEFFPNLTTNILVDEYFSEHITEYGDKVYIPTDIGLKKILRKLISVLIENNIFTLAKDSKRIIYKKVMFHLSKELKKIKMPEEYGQIPKEAYSNPKIAYEYAIRAARYNMEMPEELILVIASDPYYAANYTISLIENNKPIPNEILESLQYKWKNFIMQKLENKNLPIPQEIIEIKKPDF